MYNYPRTQTETLRRPTIMNPQPNPFENAFLGVESDIIQNGLGAYGEKIMESSSKYVQSNMSRYFSDPQYYFQVNDHYVGNKLKVILFPFIHRGHWSRIREPVDGKLSYKPPIYDINAPDLYIPLMAFGTYILLSGFLLGLQGKFSTEALNRQFTKGVFVWFFEAMLLKATLLSLGSDEAPILDIVAYSGYAFTGVVVSLLAKIIWAYSYYVVMIWECLCMGVFFCENLEKNCVCGGLYLQNGFEQAPLYVDFGCYCSDTIVILVKQHLRMS